MHIPGFTAEQSLRPARGRYRSRRAGASSPGGVVPAIPRCENCDHVLEYCATHGGRPRAACRACALGICDSSEENPGGHCRIDPISGARICDV
jgi:hypothetical protein